MLDCQDIGKLQSKTRVADLPFSSVVCILHNRFLISYEADGPGVSGWKTYSSFVIQDSRQ